MKFGIIVFPGSNCDHDCYHAVKHILKQDAFFIWHSNPDLSKCDCVIIPGGFSYGDYLRPGAIAKISPVMKEIAKFADGGSPVLGICNGFQILLETGLLPGAMNRNINLKFVCEDSFLKVNNKPSPFTSNIPSNSVLKLPVAHHDGSYFADNKTLETLEGEGRIIFKYCDKEGNVLEDTNPNGSLLNIAGICNEQRNVLGMMPHPERSMEKVLGGEDGRLIFESIIKSHLQKSKSITIGCNFSERF